MLENLKAIIRKSLKPIAKNVKSINPNTITVLGLLLSIVSGLFFARKEVVIAGFFLLLSGAFDALDGAVARENNRTTKFGEFLDSVCDRFGDAFVIIGVIYGGLIEFSLFPFFQGWFVGVVAIVGSLMVSYTRAKAEGIGSNASIGIGDRSVRMIVIIIGAFFNIVNWAILIVAVISFVTVFQRIAHVKATIK